MYFFVATLTLTQSPTLMNWGTWIWRPLERVAGDEQARFQVLQLQVDQPTHLSSAQVVFHLEDLVEILLQGRTMPVLRSGARLRALSR